MAICAIVVDGFVMKEHRGQFDGEAQNIWTDYFFFRGCHFRDVAWSRVESVIRFDEPVRLNYGRGRVHSERYLGDMFIAQKTQLFEDLLHMAVELEGRRRLFNDVLQELNDAGVRCFPVEFFRRTYKSDQALFGIYMVEEMLNLVLHSAIEHVAVPLPAVGKRTSHAFRFLNIPEPNLEHDAEDTVSLTPSQIDLRPEMFQAAANIIRGNHYCDPDDLDAISQDQVVAWLDAMTVHASGGLGHLVQMSKVKRPRDKRYVLEYLVMIAYGGLAAF